MLWLPAFACTGQSNPMHCAHRTQAGRPAYSTELISSGTVVVLQPSRAAPPRSTSAVRPARSGGIG